MLNLECIISNEITEWEKQKSPVLSYMWSLTHKVSGWGVTMSNPQQYK